MAYTDQERQAVYWVHKELKRRCSARAKAGDRQRYYERGIRVDPRWLGRGGFARFLADMGPRPTPHHEIDRIDNELGYSPDNCRWVLQPVQDANRRRSPRSLTPEQEQAVCAAIEAGETRVALAKRYGVLPQTISRIYARASR